MANENLNVKFHNKLLIILKNIKKEENRMDINLQPMQKYMFGKK